MVAFYMKEGDISAGRRVDFKVELLRELKEGVWVWKLVTTTKN